MNNKILLISDNKIFGFGGGSLEEHKYYDGLKQYSANHQDEVKVLSIDEQFDDTFSKPIVKSGKFDIFARMCGHSTFMYFIWRKFQKKIIEYNPDIIVLGRSRLGFVAKGIKKKLPVCKIVCNMENVEFDYADGYFSVKKGVARKFYLLIEKYCIKRDESMAVKFSDALNYLTKRDLQRTHELYKVNNKDEMILPICVEKEIELRKMSEKKSVVFIGSLSYGSNVSAVIKFINNVWKPYFAQNDNLSLIIGGSKPSKKIKETVKIISNCILYENFVQLEDIIPKGSLMIAPIQMGAGMKVKVAETLSMGLMIAASDEALVGYEDAIAEDHLNAIMRANTVNEYANAIKAYINTPNKILEKVEHQNKRIFKKYYSYDVSRKAIANMLDRQFAR